MLTVLWKLTIWWTILSQYVDHIVTMRWQYCGFSQYGEQYCQYIMTILFAKKAKAGDVIQCLENKWNAFQVKCCHKSLFDKTRYKKKPWQEHVYYSGSIIIFSTNRGTKKGFWLRHFATFKRQWNMKKGSTRIQ